MKSNIQTIKEYACNTKQKLATLLMHDSSKVDENIPRYAKQDLQAVLALENEIEITKAITRLVQ